MAARVARNDTVASSSSTMNTSGVSGGQRVRDPRGGGGAIDLERRDERLLPAPRHERAGRHDADERRGDDRGQPHPAFEPEPDGDHADARERRDREPERDQPVGGEPSGEQPDRRADDTSAVQAASTRRAKPFVRISPSAGQREREPLHVARPAMQRALEVRVADGVGHARAPQEPVLRRVDRQARGTDRHREQAAGDDRAAAERGERHAPRVAPPAALATRERPRGHPANTSAPIRKNCGCARPPPPSAIAARHGAPRRPERQADRRRRRTGRRTRGSRGSRRRGAP